jgi:integrase
MRGHLRKRGSTWQLIVEGARDPLTGRRRQISRSLRGTKREAEAALAQLLVEVGSGGGLAATRATFGELLDRWIELSSPDWSPSTVQVNRAFVETYIRPALGRRPLRRITVAELDRFYAGLRERGSVAGEPLSPRTVRRVHNIVHRALEQAVRWGWLASNPATKATPPKLGRLDPQPPAPADVARLLAGAAERDPEFALFLRLAAATGARRGELCGLRWNRVDLAGNAVLIDRSVVESEGGLVEKDTKTHQARRVALDGTTVALLAAHRRHCLDRAAVAQVPYPADAYVFSLAIDGAQPMNPHAVSRHFNRLCARLGLDGVRLHDLRHYVATRLIAAGVPVRTVSGRLGHASAATTLSVYSHFVEATDHDAARLLGLLLDDHAPVAKGPGSRQAV